MNNRDDGAKPSLKRRLFRVLELTDPDDSVTRWFGVFISTVILASIVALILETVASIETRFHLGFRVFEIFAVAVFTIEYVLRIWSCTADDRYCHPVTGRLRYALTPMVIIDLLAIVPFYLALGLTTSMDTRFLRALRLLRLLRLLKLGRYVRALALMGHVVRARKAELVISILIVVILLILSSSAMYMVENHAQPEQFSSIPETMWWSIATLTTVGYGDVAPITPAGRVLGGFVAVLGIGLVALPAGILASGFSEAVRDRYRTKKHCPHCGRELE
ncbi:MAG: potassium channel family protein [Thermoleophilia bacterium]|nr:potassium channel family protein [Thermoleophilia bacterium]